MSDEFLPQIAGEAIDLIRWFEVNFLNQASEREKARWKEDLEHRGLDIEGIINGLAPTAQKQYDK